MSASKGQKAYTSLKNNNSLNKKKDSFGRTLSEDKQPLITFSLLKMAGFISLFLTICYLILKFEYVLSHSEDSESFESFSSKKVVTFNSVIKLYHTETNYKLHSQDAKYGTGSGQQVVSCSPDDDDTDAFWLINDAAGTLPSPAGTPIACGAIVSFQHPSTKHHLHSHYHFSPLSEQQEVSGFIEHDTGDNWKVICIDSKGKENDSGFWHRGENVLLQHVDTSNFLASSKKYVYPNPIEGQFEVFASTKKTASARWHTKEGIYFPNVNA